MEIAGKRLKIGRLGLLIFIVIAFAGIIYGYRSTFISSRLEYASASSGKIMHEVKVGAVFANQETVLQALCPGKVSFAGENGLRLRRGETALSIQVYGADPGKNSTPVYVQDVQTPTGGLLYHEVDGLETILTPDNLVAMDLNKLLLEQPALKTPEVVQTGEAAGKVVNNLLPSAAFVSLPRLEGVEVGKTIRFTIDGQQQSAKVVRKSDSPLGVVVQFNNFIPGSVNQRNREIFWIERSAVSGTIVPVSAIVQQGEERGVYAVMDGIIHFRALKVLDEDGIQACVQDLPEGMLVIVSPHEGIEGLVAHPQVK